MQATLFVDFFAVFHTNSKGAGKKVREVQLLGVERLGHQRAVGFSSGSNLSAMSPLSVVSRAFQTSPVPPSPMVPRFHMGQVCRRQRAAYE
jgi:hypothetical protein